MSDLPAPDETTRALSPQETLFAMALMKQEIAHLYAVVEQVVGLLPKMHTRIETLETALVGLFTAAQRMTNGATIPGEPVDDATTIPHRGYL